ncbi:MAG TPA: glycosyltransferase family A protein [Dongiaceae bacterium]|nr:glycosyltransferase family A protein [Dongiaceae bacterium]
MASERPLISFIIPHKGRETMLRQTLQSIARQQADAAQIEVILVTQNPVLESDTLPLPAQLQVTTLHRPEQDTISRLRNLGVQQARGEYLAFLDADVEIAPDWVASMLAELNADPTRVLVSAVQRCADDAPPLEKIRTVLSNAVTDADVRFLPGRNLFLRRSTFEAVGGFPEHLVTCEDYYFTDRVHGLGRLYYSSRSHYVHLGEDKRYDEMYRKEIWRGQSNLQSIQGRKIPLSELPSFLVPLWIAFFALCALISLFLLSIPALLLALGLALLPVMLYSVRLHRLARGSIAFSHILHFYLLYFPARIIGTFTGLFRAIPI